MLKKVYIDARTIHTFASGIGIYTRNLLNNFPGDKSSEITLIGNRGQLSQYDWAGSARIIENTTPIYSIREQFELGFRIPKCDVFWSPHYNIPLFYRGRLVVTVLDLSHIAMPRFFAQSLHKKLYARTMFYAVRRKADAILCISQFTKDELIKYTGADNEEKIHVIHCGVDESWFDIQKKKPPHTKPFLLFVGNVKPHKNLERLISAFARIKDRIPHDLVIIGRKEGFITGDKSAIELATALSDRIHFTGYVNDDVLKQYMSYADVFILPSLYEGFGLPALEAMACGTAVIASNLASLPEVVGDAGLLADPYSIDSIAQAIQRVTEDKALADNLIRKGKERAAQFSWKQAAQKTWNIIRKVVFSN
ncbi:MAG: glycosyltransferase family 4 protein [Desulfobacteraceae bacterium]|nr:glycosyltransferase family 4 protein [Desulfobacteraceae bacterium]